MAAPTYVGTVNSFNPHKGWGFIESADAKNLYGSDVFLMKNDLNSFGVSRGDQVSFNVTQSDKGPRATNVKVLTVGPDGLQSFFGELKSFNGEKGFGFITSPASESIFSKDCFVLAGEFGDVYPEQGMHVQFKAKMGERGPVASEVRVLGQPGGFGGKGGQGGFGGKGGFGMSQWDGGFGGKGFGGKGFGGFDGGKGFGGGFDGGKGFGGKGFGGGFDGGKGFGGGFDGGKGFGGGFGGKGGFGGGYDGGFGGGFGGKGGFDGGKGGWGPSEPKESDVFFGTVKSVNEKGFAHIACQSIEKIYGRDMFAHRTSIEEANVQPGQPVSFSVSMGPKGPHAVNIQPFDEQSAGQVFVGQVKTFNETKGWGFINSPAAMQMFKSDIFLHKNELNGKTVSMGDQVSFTVDATGGRASAKNISTGAGGRAPGRN
ncbi:unnamed protein product [Polarella glacialis]|uniref:CSD domain-containing protein n=1 Tax=Polarella glacialis TaxID=89957 RepID=A0A813DWK8_POLGL|nr:unnamed protein product [Polarella glacialis]CAE8649679.1 unnamed protein product [Polarella glacialis]CAE8649680.1 unnamed protein product [Polarella glacialis]